MRTDGRLSRKAGAPSRSSVWTKFARICDVLTARPGPTSAGREQRTCIGRHHAECVDEQTLTAAMLDRLLLNAHIVLITGEIYQFKDKRRAVQAGRRTATTA